MIWRSLGRHWESGYCSIGCNAACKVLSVSGLLEKANRYTLTIGTSAFERGRKFSSGKLSFILSFFLAISLSHKLSSPCCSWCVIVTERQLEAGE